MADKPEACEWGECTKSPKLFMILDNEKYWFCSEEHVEQFWEYILETENY